MKFIRVVLVDLEGGAPPTQQSTIWVNPAHIALVTTAVAHPDGGEETVMESVSIIHFAGLEVGPIAVYGTPAAISRDVEEALS